jgi:hypothetical protein
MRKKMSKMSRLFKKKLLKAEKTLKQRKQKLSKRKVIIV